MNGSRFPASITPSGSIKRTNGALSGFVGGRFKFQKSRQLFLRVHNETLSVVISASQIPNDSAQFAPCSLLIAFPSEGQEIDCKMQSNCS